MKRITLLLCSFFMFASFTSEGKTGAFNIVGRWIDLEAKKGVKEIVFYEGYYIKLVPANQSLGESNYKYDINWEHDPYILSISFKQEGQNIECGTFSDKTSLGLKIIDENHIQIAWQSSHDGPITNSSFTKSKVSTLTRQ